MNRPKDFRVANADNILKDMDIAFEDVCAAMEEAGVNNPKKLSVFEFNQRIEYFNKKKSKNNTAKNG